MSVYMNTSLKMPYLHYVCRTYVYPRDQDGDNKDLTLRLVRLTERGAIIDLAIYNLLHYIASMYVFSETLRPYTKNKKLDSH